MGAVPAGAARPLLALVDPAGPGPLRQSRHQRLLGEPPLRRAAASRSASTSTRWSPPAGRSKWPATGAVWPSTEPPRCHPRHDAAHDAGRGGGDRRLGHLVEERDLADYDRALGVA